MKVIMLTSWIRPKALTTILTNHLKRSNGEHHLKPLMSKHDCRKILIQDGMTRLYSNEDNWYIITMIHHNSPIIGQAQPRVPYTNECAPFLSNPQVEDWSHLSLIDKVNSKEGIDTSATPCRRWRLWSTLHVGVQKYLK